MRKALAGKQGKAEPTFKALSLAPSAALAQLVLLGEEHSGRDEMNLAGHPFALLQAPGRCGVKEPIYYEWPRVLPDGKKVTASWRVEPGAQSGLPGPNEELLHLMLLQMTREAAGVGATGANASDEGGRWPQVVHFSRGELLDRLGWNDGPRGFGALQEAFTRLSAVSLTAQWAFYDARTKLPMQRVGFHILSNYAITPEPVGRKRAGALPLSWFKWDDVVYASLLWGNVRSLALDFTLSLSSPTARRLFRLLDLLRHAPKTPGKEIVIGAFKLRDRLGMTPYKHPSKIKEKLLPGIKELQSVGYLDGVVWEKARDGSLLAFFRFGNPDGAIAGAPYFREGRERDFAPSPPAIADESKQEFAHRMAGIYLRLPKEERLRLRDAARTSIEPVFWDRLEAPESPISLALWQLVEAL